MLLNEKIRALREMNDLSQEEVAMKLGMSTTGYAKIERGERRLDIPKLEEIAAVFGMDLLGLMNFDTEKVIHLISQNKQSVIYHYQYQINKDGSQHAYFNGTEQLANEIEKLKLIIAHKDELLAQKEQEFKQLNEQKNREIALLQEVIDVLKQR